MSQNERRASLPTLSVRNPADGTLEGADRVADRAAPPSPGDRASRIRAATEAGGLTAVPEEYADGDWQTILSSSLFERLHIDETSWATVDPSVVQRNYEVLRRFWNEKIAFMQQGSAETQILQRYGGPDRNRNLVLKYPERLREAWERLHTREGLEKYVAEIQADRLDRARPTLEAVLDVMFADGTVEPAETLRFYDAAAAQCVTNEQAGRVLEDAFKAHGFEPTDSPFGESRFRRLASVTWSNRADAKIPQASSVQPAASSPMFAEARPEAGTRAELAANRPVPSRAPAKSIVTIATIAAALLVALFAVAALFVRPSRTESEPGVSNRIPTEAAQSLGSAPVESPPAESRPEPRTEIRASVPEAQLDRVVPVPTAEPVSRAIASPAVSDSDRARARESLRVIKESSAVNPAAALDEIGSLDEELSRHPQDYAAERVELVMFREQLKASIALTEQRRQSQLEESARAAEARDAEWARRLAAIEDLMQSGNFSGAEKLAAQLAKEPGVPETVAQSARKLGDEAFVRLQDSWSQAKVSSKTTRAKKN